MADDRLFSIREADEGVVRYFATLGVGTKEDPFLYQMATFPIELQINMGKLPGYITEDKFGENPDVDTAEPEDVWEYGGLYNYDPVGTAPILYLSSSSTLDNQSIGVLGLDIDGYLVNQTVALNGQNNVTLSTPLWRVFRLENEADDGENINGIVYCHTDINPINGVPISTAVRAIIDDGNNQTLMAIYTVPRGKVGFLYKGELGMSRAVTTTGAVQGAYYSRRYGKVFKIKKRVDIVNSGSSVYQDFRSFPDIIPALTDIKLRIEAVSANNTGVFGTFDIMLIDESEFSPEYLQAIGQPGY